MPLLLLADVDWTVIVSATGTALVLVVGAVGAQIYRVKSARWAFEREQKAADDRTAATRKAGDRRDRKDTIEEYQQILDIKEKDGREWREQVHDLRDMMMAQGNRLAICEWDRARLTLMVEDLSEAVQRAGIVVHYRIPPAHPMPVYPTSGDSGSAEGDGEVSPHGPSAPEDDHK